MARHPRALLLLLVVAVVALAPPARAVDSLDWMIADSDLVVRGRVQVVWEKKDPRTGRYDWEEASIKVYETLKGPPPKGNELKVLRPTSHFVTAPWGDGPCLFLLVDGRRATYLKSPDFLEGRHLLVDPHARMIPLEEPARGRPLTSTRDYRAQVYAHPVQNADGRSRRLTDPEEILAAAGEAVARQRGATRRLRPALIDLVLDDLPGFSQRPVRLPYDDPGPLTVPADENWERVVERQLARGQALHWLTDLAPARNPRFLRAPDGQAVAPPHDYFKNDRTIAMMRRILDDPWGTIRTRPGEWVTPLDRFEYRLHLNREWAYEVLRAWDVRTPPPAMTSPLLPRRPIRLLSAGALATLFALGLPALVGRRTGVRSTVTWVCVLLTIAAFSMWQRSGSTYDSLILAITGAEHEFSSARGRLHYLRIAGGPKDLQPEPRAPSHGSVVLADPAVVPHHLDYLPKPDHGWAGAGVITARGLTLPAPGYGVSAVASPTNAYRYLRLTIHYPWLILAFGLYPLLRLLGRLRRRLRGWWRVRRLRCSACGYDLRHRPRRCPECGAPTPAALHAPNTPATPVAAGGR